MTTTPNNTDKAYNSPEEYAKTVIPANIGPFINEIRSLANEMETMQMNTPLELQALEASKLMFRYGCV